MFWTFANNSFIFCTLVDLSIAFDSIPGKEHESCLRSITAWQMKKLLTNTSLYTFQKIEIQLLTLTLNNFLFLTTDFCWEAHSMRYTILSGNQWLEQTSVDVCIEYFSKIVKKFQTLRKHYENTQSDSNMLNKKNYFFPKHQSFQYFNTMIVCRLRLCSSGFEMKKVQGAFKRVLFVNNYRI